MYSTRYRASCPDAHCASPQLSPSKGPGRSRWRYSEASKTRNPKPCLSSRSTLTCRERRSQSGPASNSTSHCFVYKYEVIVSDFIEPLLGGWGGAAPNGLTAARTAQPFLGSAPFGDPTAKFLGGRCDRVLRALSRSMVARSPRQGRRREYAAIGLVVFERAHASPGQQQDV